MSKESDLPEQLNAKKENFPEWMSQVLQLGGIIDNRYDIKSMFVWMPYGYDMMLRIKKFWDEEFKKNDIKEMYFPLMVPVKYAEQNASWWEGFKEEGFWAGSKEKQEFILRPTGEPAMYPMFSLWIRGHNDLPFRIYETVFSYRYESRQTRPLIRDREIGPWFEIHTAHATKEDAETEIELARKMSDKIWKFIGIKPLLVKKPKWECFPGAEGSLEYYTLMPNGKVMENSSLNNLGQAYAKKFNIKFKDKDGEEKYVWQTCTGNGERYLSAVIAQHGDDKGLVLPPNIAPVQVMIIPIFNKKNKEKVVAKCEAFKKNLTSLRTEIDLRDVGVGNKFYDSELRGIPLRLEVGEKEMQDKKVSIFIRDSVEKVKVLEKDLKKSVQNLLKEMQDRMLKKSGDDLKNALVSAGSLDDLKSCCGEGKIGEAYWCGGEDCADKIDTLKDGLEIIGSNVKDCTPGNCVVCSKKTKIKAFVANSY